MNTDELTNEQLFLITLKEELYEDSWDLMLEDLNERLESRPYIVKLTQKIRHDIDMIKELQEAGI